MYMERLMSFSYQKNAKIDSMRSIRLSKVFKYKVWVSTMWIVADAALTVLSFVQFNMHM